MLCGIQKEFHMIGFLRVHFGALRLVFLAALLAYVLAYVAYDATWRWLPLPFEVERLIGVLRIAGTFPWSWLVVTPLDPLLWKLPLYLQGPILTGLFAVGFAFNVALITGVFWCRYATGRWWPNSVNAKVA
jgi:hypothetical protein